MPVRVFDELQLVPVGEGGGTAIEADDPRRLFGAQDDGVVPGRALDRLDAGKRLERGEVKGAAAQQPQGVVAAATVEHAARELLLGGGEEIIGIRAGRECNQGRRT
jgi:hypothetical protein